MHDAHTLLIEAEQAVVTFWPATQSVHVWQATATSMPDPVEYAPAEQEVHVETSVTPDAVEYVPVPQRVHWPAVGRPRDEL